MEVYIAHHVCEHQKSRRNRMKPNSSTRCIQSMKLIDCAEHIWRKLVVLWQVAEWMALYPLVLRLYYKIFLYVYEFYTWTWTSPTRTQLLVVCGVHYTWRASIAIHTVMKPLKWKCIHFQIHMYWCSLHFYIYNQSLWMRQRQGVRFMLRWMHSLSQ